MGGLEEWVDRGVLKAYIYKRFNIDKVGYVLRTDGLVWVDGWTRGMGGWVD
jgi:hypothetical protein